MAGENVKNYGEQGGSRTVVGGSLDVVSGGDLDLESGGTLKIAGTAVTPDAAELNVLDGATAGAVVASKALVADSVLGLAGLRAKVETKTAAYTVVAGDSRKVFIADAVDLVFTLPATVAGLTYTFVAKTVSVTTGLAISPAAADKIMGDGFTSADNKDAINTAATDREGDAITLVGDGVDGWFIVSKSGTWARET